MERSGIELHSTDILVIGAGFAGIIAAISAAEAGAQVTLASCGSTCSGSSFYPGTWGFGLVGPENQDDIPDLVDTVIRVGEYVVDKEMVETFAAGIPSGIAYLMEMGVPLKEAKHTKEREFIPCFDHKNRSWHGIVKETAKPVFLERLRSLGVSLMPHTLITELLQEPDGRVCGAIGIRSSAPVEIFCKAVIIASGGLGGLFEHRLNPSDVTGMGQYLALKAGAELVNLEFLQMMPGFLSPAYGTVFNEKVFRYARSDAFGSWTEGERKRLLTLRSGHGPYTCRLESGRVDEALMEAWKSDPAGAKVCYDPAVKDNPPEFVKTYFDWLLKEKGLTPDDPVRVGIFAHASNGGIRIDCKCRTGVPGLYACGEATGGMHGADRLGGLSTANALVFGRIAGGEAAACARAARRKAAQKEKPQTMTQAAQTVETAQIVPHGSDGQRVEKAKNVRMELHRKMSQCAMISRDWKRCKKVLDWLEDKAVEWSEDTVMTYCPEEYAQIKRLESEIGMARCLMTAILLRRESRGTHHRVDCPEKDQSMSCMIAVFYGKDKIETRWI